MSLEINKIEKLINDASNVIIMAHKNLDLDALGSSLGMYYLCKNNGKNTFLLIEEQKSEKGVARALNELKNRDIKINIKTLNELKFIINDKTLLIILDVHIPNIMQNTEILTLVNNIIVIDHHIHNKININNIQYSYIDETISSAAEIIVGLLKELDIYIPPYIATIMLAGIVIDTNHFSIKTSHLTYGAAAYLCIQKADLKELQYLLKENFNRYLQRQEIIRKVEIIKDKLAIGEGKAEVIYYPDDIAKVADTLLLFNNIEATFTIAKIDDHIIGISARSLGNVNVQKIMETMGGGGHYTEAATQLENTTIKEAKSELLKVIEKYI
ncbi:MAG: DHH family phosphoesterase [Bacilli bacterium]|nr:DHH family phosphoesterase [Bacilli bacterium]